MTRSYLDRLIDRSSGEPGALAAQPRARHERTAAPLDDPFERSAPLVEEPREVKAPAMATTTAERRESRSASTPAPAPAVTPAARSLEPLRSLLPIAPRREAPPIAAAVPAPAPALSGGAEGTTSARAVPLVVREMAEQRLRPLPDATIIPRDEPRSGRAEIEATTPVLAAPPSLEPTPTLARPQRAEPPAAHSMEAPRPLEAAQREPLERASAAPVEAPAMLMPRPLEAPAQEPSHEAPRITIGRVRVEVVASAPLRPAPLRPTPHAPAAPIAGRRSGFPSKLRFGLGQS